MPHVLPPQPSGALAALRAGDETDIVFAAHTGLGLAAYPSQFWRDMPIGRTLHTRMWFVPASEVPAGDEARIAWLYDWWKRIDEWIDAHRAGPPSSDGAAPAVRAQAAACSVDWNAAGVGCSAARPGRRSTC